MILSSFTYKEIGWKLKELAPLSFSNLLVGKNATGKTRTIRALQVIASFMQMKEFVPIPQSFETEMQFSDSDESGDPLFYSFKLNNGKVENEYLSFGGQTLIERTKVQTKLLSETINPPSDKLVVQVRRDESQYPVVEKLMKWAEGITCIKCANINSITISGRRLLNPYSFRELVENLKSPEKKVVMDKAAILGYGISELSTIEIAPEVKVVLVKEKSIANRMPDMQLSNGMLRTLYVLCFLSALKNLKKVSMLLIDDLGEGLDYFRSTELGKMVFEECERNGIQLIASSNDSFLMDVVNIDNWQVLRRDGSKVFAINCSNNPELFRKFKLTGLSNFDLFSSDFIDNYFSKSGVKDA